ncbi:MAG TPA: hypothetical protein DCZ55_15950 [Cyanobacteria bacterium UBA11371]|nr:hypothetical protein [Cyanobacteria bacterium UBA11371]
MDAFAPIPPDWTDKAIHAHEFHCPSCRASCMEAQRVWINRRSPVYTEDYRKKWQEFYECKCRTVWWAWSNERPPSEFTKNDLDPNPFDD